MDSAGRPSLLLNGAAAPAFGSDFTFTSAQPIKSAVTWRTCAGWPQTLDQALDGNGTRHGSVEFPRNVSTAEGIAWCIEACCLASSCFAWVAGPG